ncbi:l-aminoadipate-semialdehyde dehydrogenase large subunit [Lasallia pustulata]|uniref:Alpha-aminoadipate reductase n=1 Tax=Lasallia pustulata TaxID=136370 RepID=A0A1W5CUZ3_9LECA|nr:l-aminoadipate-semialdehyde dehydrogenase large subunit [Lasallia pustulata]
MSSNGDSRAELPDPTVDLHWSEFRGAIHDIFAANAERHPERLCVAETSSESSPRREFTYRQIHEGSSLLAHHLVTNGIQRGDVVMVYAYRGVDLVVAVMGVLKAGATFSVIDPAYPPDRQIIYLEVAQPRALVIIEKATIEAGELSSKVRSFIQEHLQLKTEVPGLRIDNNGNLHGGIFEGHDIFDSQRSQASTSPGVLVGPDSNPTLSFTSGSEGRPKGVLGRHFSLAYYFPWMAKRFDLSENDRFTMLSGIAHDPIQRDIFTPLFLGAHMLVPSKEDIQHERLAEWMREHGATVTHLTPAMGQILVGGATTEFSALHHAFFVGDILTKRDCNLLRNLAPNVNIINMYGTTETQRAVSYYELPSRSRDPNYMAQMGDVIPAGKGMLDVQLLVVNQADKSKLCTVGEVGEIYVRAGGLAEGYLGDKKLNDMKFVQNWFVDPQKWVDLDRKKAEGESKKEDWRELYKGPRDRLYRTGDLGRYTARGDVECTGRADDQVKIRGFRIELGEINKHLSGHELIRDCITLVRRDKDEEQTLVSYVVPEFKRWPEWLESKGLQEGPTDQSMVSMLKRFRPLRDAVREHLKGKLPSYAVPTVFVPLNKLPLNPNGKVDKPALPFPDIAEFAAAAPRKSSMAWNSLSGTERLVAQLWGNLIPGCNARAIGPSDSFFDLGGHSILAQQMLFTTKRKLNGVQISMASLFRDPTLRGFAAEIDRIRNPGLVSAGADGQLRQANGHVNGQKHDDEDYAGDARRLVQGMPKTFPSVQTLSAETRTVFLTGATGFLGAYILRDLLERQFPALKVISHVRAKSSEAAFERVRQSCRAYGVWSDAWTPRLTCVSGNLGDSQLGITAEVWRELLTTVDIVIHNGAQVHWVYPYSKLKPANVQGTLDALQLCASGKPKQFAFVSSTSVLDTEDYVKLSEQSVKSGGNGVSEADDLEGSSTGLGTGYGQSKWVSEYLVREAGRRGLRGTIVRPGYVLGDSRTGVTNTDDFLIRLLKGCLQLSSRPHITNTVNMVPVDHVARVVVASAFHPPVSPLGVAQVTSHPRLRFHEYLATLQEYGYDVPEVDYPTWRSSLEKYVSADEEPSQGQHALMPLYHFVTGDLPATTIAPELDDANAVAALRADADWTGEDVSGGAAVTKETMGLYLSYLVAVGFLPAPEGGQGRLLPEVRLGEEQRRALGGVGGRGMLV